MPLNTDGHCKAVRGYPRLIRQRMPRAGNWPVITGMGCVQDGPDRKGDITKMARILSYNSLLSLAGLEPEVAGSRGSADTRVAWKQ